MSSKENKDNASARDMVAPSGQKWRNNYGFYQSKKVFSIISFGNIIRYDRWCGEIVNENKY